MTDAPSPQADTVTRADAEIIVRRAARALGRHGLVHAYGHCSQRLDADHFLVCTAKPLGTIAPGEAGTVVPVAVSPRVVSPVPLMTVNTTNLPVVMAEVLPSTMRVPNTVSVVVVVVLVIVVRTMCFNRGGC